MPKSAARFGREFDQTAAAGVRAMPLRIGTLLPTGFLVGWSIGWGLTAAWVAAALFTELCTLVCTRNARSGRPIPTLDKVVFVITGTLKSIIWAGLAVLLWITGEEALRIGAVALLCGQLIHAISYASRYDTLLAMTAAPPLVMLGGIILLHGGYRPVHALTLGAGLMMLCLYWLRGVIAGRKNIAELEAAHRLANEASQAKSAFLAMMSHELRTPMNGVLGMAHALKTSELNAEQSDQVDMLLRAGDGLMTILNDILDLSKIEAGKLELEVTPFDLIELSEQVEALWRETAQAKGLSLRLSIDPATPRWVAGDPTRLRQILLNLVSNAVKFTAEGEVAIAVRALGAPGAAPARIEFAVADNGIGMTEEQLDRLFQDFTQAAVSTTRQFGGTGLGLSICRRLADMMGGAIVAESAPGQGSTFRVTVPLPLAQPLAAAEAEPAAEAGGLTGLRILVVEDNTINQAVARAILEAVGAAVEVADDGAAALDRLRTDHFDLVLMDVHMPRMGGEEALARIRAGEAGPAVLPVIALTADAMHGDTDRLRGQGFDDVQPKPIQPMALVSAIAMVLTRADARHAA